MSKIIVTGINGFVGKHLARELAGRDYQVIGVGREELDTSIANCVTEYHLCDLTNEQQVSSLPIADVAGIISLAGLAQVGASFNNPELYKKINVEVLTRLCQRLIDEKIVARVIAVSTGAVYASDQPLPLTENSLLVQEGQGSPYALSKILMEEEIVGLRDQGLDCRVARPLNHIGPGQETGFLVPDLDKNIREARDNGTPLKVGNLDTRRDYTDVRDVVRAYADLLETSDTHEVYNICSGRSVSGREILGHLLALEGASALEIKVDQSLIRPNDPPELYGSNARLHSATGWQPEIQLEQTLQDFVQSQSTLQAAA